MEHYEQYIGKTLNGKYQITELVGSGGMSHVFKANVVGTDDVVSVKILNEESSHDENAVQRFINESKAVSMLSHTNIVKIYDVAFESDINYLVMEYVDGITLKEYIDYKKNIEWVESVYYVSQILKALGHAHSTGIIHRDVKPQNIMITRDGTVKVMDFGIAKMLKSESITMTDMALGTVDYISPEQASGKEVGFYSDIYSVGVMLYEMTTGRLPFIADSPMAVAMMQVQDEPVPPRDIDSSLPIGLEQIILKAMSKEPDERFSSCGAMARALELLSGDPTTVFADHVKPKRKKKKNENEKKRSSLLPVITGVTIAFFAVAAVVGINLLTKFYDQFSETGEDVRIPNLVGKELTDELRSQLDEDRFEITEEKGAVHDPSKKTGEIIEQNPEAGTTRKLSNSNSLCPITVTLNPAPQKTVIENFINQSSQSVELKLDTAELMYERVYQHSATVIEGYIISTEPVAGTEVEKGSTVILTISKGTEIETSMMPNIIGITKDRAIAELQANNISVGDITLEHSSEYEAGLVIRASHEKDTAVAQKLTEVSFVVSMGPEVPIIPVQPNVIEIPADEPSEDGGDEPTTDENGASDEGEESENGENSMENIESEQPEQTVTEPESENNGETNASEEIEEDTETEADDGANVEPDTTDAEVTEPVQNGDSENVQLPAVTTDTASENDAVGTSDAETDEVSAEQNAVDSGEIADTAEPPVSDADGTTVAE